MSVTLIAEKAGVSIATVSRVLNNSRNVNPEIAERVHKAVAELQISPRQNKRRRRLSDRQSTVAIVSLGRAHRHWFEMPVIANMIAELTRAAEEQHMGVLITEMPDPNELSPVLHRPEVEGALVFIDQRIEAKDTTVLRGHLPVVRVLGGHLSPQEIDQVGVDNNAVGHLAGRYLLKNGLKEIAFLATTPSWELTKLRAQGFIAAVELAGIMPTVYLEDNGKTPLGAFGGQTVVASDMTTLIDRLASKRKGPVGLFVARDEETVRVYHLLREAGLEAGKDVIVVSCDNERVRLSTLHPRPASIDFQADQIARHAILRQMKRIQNPDEPPVRILVYPRLEPGELDSF